LARITDFALQGKDGVLGLLLLCKERMVSLACFCFARKGWCPWLAFALQGKGGVLGLLLLCKERVVSLACFYCTNLVCAFTIIAKHAPNWCSKNTKLMFYCHQNHINALPLVSGGGFGRLAVAFSTPSIPLNSLYSPHLNPMLECLTVRHSGEPDWMQSASLVSKAIAFH
jgi:hypothetical protein